MSLLSSLLESLGVAPEFVDSFLSHAFIALATLLVARLVFASPSSSSSSSSSPSPSSSVSSSSIPSPSSSWVASFDGPSSPSSDRSSFLAVFPHLVSTCLSQCEANELPSAASSWVGNMLRYNVTGGKLNRGLQVVVVQRTLKGVLSGREFARAAVLGWAIEFLQAFFLVADDVMDDSLTRRGQPCWYKQPHVRMIAINDSFLLESFVFSIIKEYFGDEAYYGDLVGLFLSVIQKTEFGQLLDLTSQPMESGSSKGPDLDLFTLERYKLIVKYKTAYYTFYLPIAIGMITSGVKDKKTFEIVEEICVSMGEYFQVQDDFLDCYGDPAVIGKVGTDIQDNKCSWLIVQALERANDKQKSVLKENYGRDKESKIKKVKEVFNEIDLKKVFEKYETDSYDMINSKIDKVAPFMPKEVFELLLKKIYKRQK